MNKPIFTPLQLIRTDIADIPPRKAIIYLQDFLRVFSTDLSYSEVNQVAQSIDHFRRLYKDEKRRLGR